MEQERQIQHRDQETQKTPEIVMYYIPLCHSGEDKYAQIK